MSGIIIYFMVEVFVLYPSSRWPILPQRLVTISCRLDPIVWSKSVGERLAVNVTWRRWRYDANARLRLCSTFCLFSSRVASRSRSAISDRRHHSLLRLCCGADMGATQARRWVIGHSIAAMDDRFLSACVDWLRVCLQQSRHAICLTFEVFNASVCYIYVPNWVFEKRKQEAKLPL